MLRLKWSPRRGRPPRTSQLRTSSGISYSNVDYIKFSEIIIMHRHPLTHTAVQVIIDKSTPQEEENNDNHCEGNHDNIRVENILLIGNRPICALEANLRHEYIPGDIRNMRTLHRVHRFQADKNNPDTESVQQCTAVKQGKTENKLWEAQPADITQRQCRTWSNFAQ